MCGDQVQEEVRPTRVRRVTSFIRSCLPPPLRLYFPLPHLSSSTAAAQTKCKSISSTSSRARLTSVYVFTISFKSAYIDWMQWFIMIDLDHGRSIQRWCCRWCWFTDDYWKLHCMCIWLHLCKQNVLKDTMFLNSIGQSSNRQTHSRPWPYLLLPIGFSSRYSSYRRYGSLSSPNACVCLFVN